MSGSNKPTIRPWWSATSTCQMSSALYDTGTCQWWVGRPGTLWRLTYHMLQCSFSSGLPTTRAAVDHLMSLASLHLLHSLDAVAGHLQGQQDTPYHHGGRQEAAQEPHGPFQTRVHQGQAGAQEEAAGRDGVIVTTLYLGHHFLSSVSLLLFI